MKRYAHMEILDLTIPLDENHYFFDDGFVDDIYNHYKELRKKYNVKQDNIDEEKKRLSFLNIRGKTEIFKYGNKKHGNKIFIHIYYKKHKCDIDWNGVVLNKDVIDIITRAHEETHVLNFLGKTGYLKKKIIKNLLCAPIKPRILEYINPALLFSKEPEKIARLGENYIIFKYGYPVEYKNASDSLFDNENN